MPVAEAVRPAGWNDLRYYRLHGSPQTYYSNYSDAYLEALAEEVTDAAAGGCRVWCIFDNTALGAATGNALRLQQFLQENEVNGRGQ